MPRGWIGWGRAQATPSQQRNNGEISPAEGGAGALLIRNFIRLAAAALLLAASGGAASAQVMSLPGQFAVGATGAATYSIPIAVPPSTAGMTPALTLDYNSHSGNGILGVGWSLSGLPQIARCPMTIAQDGIAGSVNYDGNDRFCLDGQRLVAVNGAYGADGTEYRLEVEAFTRFISHGTAGGSGPQWFEAHTKSGQIMQFGVGSAGITAQGDGQIRVWALNQVSDTKGNYFNVTYNDDTANGQGYPLEIDYTGNTATGLAPYNKIQFIYTSRSDVQLAYQAGSLVETTSLLSAVEMSANGTLVNAYMFTYQSSGATKQSLLSSVSLCDFSGACLPSTNLTWTASNNAFTQNGNLPEANISGAYQQWVSYAGDFNGDGKTDLLWVLSDTYGRSLGMQLIWLSNGDGTFSVDGNVPEAGVSGAFAQWRPYIGDFNGDGKADILWIMADQYGRASGAPYLQIWLSNGDGTFSQDGNLPEVTITGAFQQWMPYVGDFNGDGKADIFWVFSDTSGRSLGQQQIWLSNGDGTFTQDLNVPEAGVAGAFTQWRPSFGDFNGDGKTDVLWFMADEYGRATGAPNLQIWLSNESGTFTQDANLPEENIAGAFQQWMPYVGDFNGDGKADILWVFSDTYGRSLGQQQVWLSTGGGTFVQDLNVPEAGVSGAFSQWRPSIGDFNGDGKADVLWILADQYGRATGAPNLQIWLSNGDGTFTQDSNLPEAGTPGAFQQWTPSLGDFNGDGKTDVLWIMADQYGRAIGAPYMQTWLTDGVGTDLLNAATTGIGATTSITYEPLTNSTVYTKDNTAAYPLIDLQTPLYVTSRVDAANGIGGTYSSTYSYAGAKLDLSGRGFLGFRQKTVTDLQTSIVQTANYHQDFPYIGLIGSGTKAVSGGPTLNSSVYSYQFLNAANAATVSVPSLSSAPYRVSQSQSAELSADLDGTQLPTVTTTYQYDPYNNPTQIAVSTPDGASKATSNTYTNDTTNWFLGRLTGATVTSTLP